MVFLYILGVAGFASRGIKLIICMQLLRRCDCGVFLTLILLDLLLEGLNLSYICTV